MKTNEKTGVELYKDPGPGRLLAMVIRHDFTGEKYNFLTSSDSAMQLGVNSYAAGERVKPHIHVEREKTIVQSQECIVVKKGRVVFYVFDAHKNLVAKTTLFPGDIAFQNFGGHAFEMQEDTQIIEVKQGPFGGDKDKIRFDHPGL